MNVFNNPPRENWAQICQRPELDLEFLEGSVKNIMNRVKSGGDDALKDLTREYDKVELENLTVTQEETVRAGDLLDEKLKASIRQAGENIRKFHATQLKQEQKIETMPGVLCWRKTTPIQSIGIYVPGGSAPLFSTVLMLAVPASIARCKKIVLCSPPDKSGGVAPTILFAAQLAGVNQVFKVGGAQAIAGMAYGTETIPQVDKIFGPGNQYVTKAKQLVNQQGIAIDLPAGPSELLIVADETATPEFVAADLLSQAEHGEDSQVVLVVGNDSLAETVHKEVLKQLATLPRKAIATQALKYARIVILNKENDQWGAGTDGTVYSTVAQGGYSTFHKISHQTNSDATSGNDAFAAAAHAEIDIIRMTTFAKVVQSFKNYGLMDHAFIMHTNSLGVIA
jgi:histidinol dehydrogenase